MAKKMSRFAHFLGRSVLASEEEDDRKETQEEDKDDAKGKKAKSRKAEDEKDDPDADDGQDDPDGEDDSDDPDASEDDDDDEEGAEDGDDEKEAKAVKQGRRAERDRCARIFGSQHAAGNVSMAATLAFDTGMSSAQAIKIMASSGVVVGANVAPVRMSLDQRMSKVRNVQLGVDEKPADTSSAKGRAGVMTSLYNRAKGVK